MHPQHIFDAKLHSLATSSRNMGSSLLHPCLVSSNLFQLNSPAPLSPYRVGLRATSFPLPSRLQKPSFPWSCWVPSSSSPSSSPLLAVFAFRRPPLPEDAEDPSPQSSPCCASLCPFEFLGLCGSSFPFSVL